MKIISKNCSKIPSKDVRRKGMAAIGACAYVLAIPKNVIEVVPSKRKQPIG